MSRVPYLELLPGHAPTAEEGQVDLSRHLVGSTPVLLVPLEFVAQVAKDLDVQHWLIGCTEIERTRSAYLDVLNELRVSHEIGETVRDIIDAEKKEKTIAAGV